MAKYLILQETRRNGFISVFFPPVVCVKHEIFILIALNAKVNLNSRRFLGLRGKKKKSFLISWESEVSAGDWVIAFHQFTENYWIF